MIPSIGVESGLDTALTYMNKGHTAEEAREQLLRLTEAGMDYSRVKVPSRVLPPSAVTGSQLRPSIRDH